MNEKYNGVDDGVEDKCFGDFIVIELNNEVEIFIDSELD